MTQKKVFLGFSQDQIGRLFRLSPRASASPVTFTFQEFEYLIEVETDPFQYLFMGEYGFASCLSMRGAYFWGAVSNAIDVDKVVLWAREASGNIVGRRLIALVPGGILSYRTYANRHGLALDRFFRDFITSYAEHCNTIQIHEGTPGPLLSDRWYDDRPI